MSPGFNAFMRPIRIILGLGVCLLFSALLVLAFPDPWFGHRVKSGRFEVLSDQPLDPAAVSAVLADVERRIRRSAIFTPDQTFRLFVCNDLWKFYVFSQRGRSNAGAVADGWLTRNVYFRPVDFARNQIIPPTSWMYDRSDRPLSYFIAHEVAHIMVSRRFGRLSAVRHPAWLNEGYADYVGKGGQFDVPGNLALLKAGDPLLDPARSGLYRRYHLAVAYELDHRRQTLEQVFSANRPEAAVLTELKSDSTFGETAAGSK